MRLRWLLVAGRYELAAFDIAGRTWVSLASVWQTSERWSAAWTLHDNNTFRTRAAAMAYVEDELTQEVMSLHARRQ